MSFCGKKYKRVGFENIEQLIQVLDTPEAKDRMSYLMKSSAEFWFDRKDEKTMTYTLVSGGRTMVTTFKLGEMTEVERRDGGKINVTYFLENDNVIKQSNVPNEGKVIYFRREFTDDKCTMTISVDGSNVQAKVFYELVD